MKLHAAGIALFLLFRGLKLTGHIDWSWWWVTAPLWITAGLSLTLAVVFGTIAFLHYRFKE